MIHWSPWPSRSGDAGCRPGTSGTVRCRCGEALIVSIIESSQLFAQYVVAQHRGCGSQMQIDDVLLVTMEDPELLYEEAVRRVVYRLIEETGCETWA